MRYRQKLSGPIMDRIDLHVEVAEVEHEKLLARHASDSSETTIDNIQKQITDARQIQFRRYSSRTKLNADITNKEIKDSGYLAEDAQKILNEAAKRINISARSYIKAVKVARTIADLGNSRNIETNHITEALSLRPQLTNLM